MATHKLAILVSAIGAAKAAKDLKGVDAAVSSIGGKAGQGLRTAGKNLVGLGAIAAGGIAIAVKTGLDDLATLETAVTSVDGAIKQLGLTGQVTGAQVADWANQIEASVGAAFDDKDITAATATLIRFGKVTPTNLRSAMVVMTDLAAKTGSVESASTLLSKALADPTKAAGKLARQGIILTKAQQKQIAAFVKAGQIGKAQAVILDAVSQSTKGAAEASQGPYARSLSVLADVSEDARKALAEGFLPVIQKVADLLSSELAKPETLTNIRNFGKGLASGLDSLINIAKGLPWGAIGDSLKIAGQGATSVLNAFASLPSWVQTAVLTGWGLNKLSGGALGDIVGELAKGLIKGVLGITAAVVNVKGAVVNGGGGGLPGGVPGGAGAAGAGGLLALGGTAITGAAAFVGLAEIQNAVSGGIAKGMAGGNADLEKRLNTVFDFGNATSNPIGQNLIKLPGAIQQLAGEIDKFVKGPSPADLPTGDIHDENRKKSDQIRKAIDDSKAKAAIGFLATQRSVSTSGQNVSGVVRSGTSGTTAATNAGSSRIVGAIHGIPAPITTVKVYVTAAKVSQSVVTQERVGKGNGSGGSGSNGGGSKLT